MGINTREIVSKPKANIEFFLQEPQYTLQDVVLKKETTEQIQDFLSFYHNRKLLFDNWGLEKRYKNRKNLCINLYGESGTGKTMTAHALAGMMKKKLLQVNYADIESKYVGDTSKNLQKMFAFAGEQDVIILFDEADALLSKRVTDMSNATDVSVNQTRSVLLTLLENYEGIVIFTTNFISNYDVAFMRRIQFHIKFSLPDENLRVKLWRFYLDISLPNTVNVEELAQKYENISAADIANAVFNAAVITARKSEAVMSHKNLEEALKRIIKSKEAHSQEIKVFRREVSEAYVNQQMGGKIQ